MLTTVSTKGMTREDWLRHRRLGIGGSDAAAIVGLNKYSTPLTVWMDKTGRAEEQEETEAMRLGHDLEDYVAKRFAEATGKAVRKKNAIIRNTEYTWAHANIDREIVGEKAILECKTTSKLTMRKFPAGEYPANYYVQVMHYLAVTGAEKGYLAVLVLQEGLRIFEITRNEDEIGALMRAEETFWKYVQEDREPPAVAEDLSVLDEAHPESDGTQVDLFGRAAEMRRYLEIKDEIKGLEAEADGIAAALKQELGEHERGADGEYAVTWKSQTRSTFDRKAFQAARPDIDLKPWMRETTARVFTVKHI